MLTEANLDTVEYRVVLVDPVSRGVLAREEDGSFCVLRVSIPPRTRAVRQVRAKLERSWGIAVVILDFLSAGHNTSPCVVAELLMPSIPTGFRVVSAGEIASEELAEPERTHLNRVLGDDVTSPFSRIGWIDEAIAWVEGVTGQQLRSKTSVEQHSAGGAFTLLRFPMADGHTYWLKATDVPNANERTLTALLSRLCGNCLPRFVAEKVDWNAWLTLEEAYGVSALPTEPDDVVRLLGPAVESLAELQLKTVGLDQVLIDAGAFDQRLHVLRTDADELFAYVAEAMTFQTSTKVPRIETSRLQEIRTLFDEACRSAECFEMPSTILHGDMNLGNLVFARERCQLIDWCEGYVGHPFVTFQHLLLLNPIENPVVRASVDDVLKGIYRTAMHTVCDSRQMKEGLASMPLLAAASALYGRGDWLCSDARNAPGHYAYARTIGRHMDHAAQEPRLLEALCV
jgi:Phosphotransferase enzyme family